MLNLEDFQKFPQESTRQYADGELIFMEGDDSREMYVVIEGEVTVSKLSMKGEVVLAILKKGEFVGEMSLLESMARSATARARGPTKLLAIHPGGFLLKIRRDPSFAVAMLKTLSCRIRTTNNNLMQELARNEATADSLKRVISNSDLSTHSSTTDHDRGEKEKNLELTDGQSIFNEGENSHEMFVVASGEVVVTKKTAQGTVELAVLRKGEFVGEMSLLEGLPRMASATARGPTKLLSISPGSFMPKIRRDPTFAFEMLQTLSRRIRLTNDALMNELNRMQELTNGSSSAESLKEIITVSEFTAKELN